MDPLFLIARVLHIGFGVFWAGTLMFNAALLYPAMVEAGPDGAKISAGLIRRGMPVVLPVAALLVIVSGFYMYWRDSAISSGAFSRSSMGMTYGVGAVLTLVAFGIGVGVMRPAMLTAQSLVEGAANAKGDERDKALAAAQALRARAGRAGQVVAWVLVLVTVAMAVARYV